MAREYLVQRRSEIETEGLDVETLLATAAETPDAASILRRFGRYVEGR